MLAFANLNESRLDRGSINPGVAALPAPEIPYSIHGMCPEPFLGSV